MILYSSTRDYTKWDFMTCMLFMSSENCETRFSQIQINYNVSDWIMVEKSLHTDPLLYMKLWSDSWNTFNILFENLFDISRSFKIYLSFVLQIHLIFYLIYIWHTFWKSIWHSFENTFGIRFAKTFAIQLNLQMTLRIADTFEVRLKIVLTKFKDVDRRSWWKKTTIPSNGCIWYCLRQRNTRQLKYDSNICWFSWKRIWLKSFCCIESM